MTDRKTLILDSTELTKAQRERIEFLRTRFAPRDGYEFKQFEINQVGEGKSIFVHLETGLINDEGTMAAIYARDRYGFCIGKRGGLESHDGNKYQRNYTRDKDYQARNKRIAERKQAGQ